MPVPLHIDYTKANCYIESKLYYLVALFSLDTGGQTNSMFSLYEKNLSKFWERFV